jgi:hypothetical protein
MGFRPPNKWLKINVKSISEDSRVTGQAGQHFALTVFQWGIGTSTASKDNKALATKVVL